ncbi:MAG: imidazolonepropionase [Nitriliruptor sp.]|nr:MAG: imidazolonepropionase [Nitriliruptor sp.]
MSSTCFDRIAELVTNRPELGDGSPLGLRRDAAVVVADGEVVWVGDAGAAPATDDLVELAGRCVLPSFVDSHSHLVFGGERAEEFAARMAGRAYTAGGIRTTIAATRAAPVEQLRRRAGQLIAEMRRQGTGVVEIKSGYGAEVATERRSLEVAGELTGETTYLGAHVVAPEFVDDPSGYVELVTGEMLDSCAPLARWIDVFVEDGAFDGDQARTILRAGAERGLGARVHANQLGPGPGVQVACEVGAASADHCTHLDGGDVAALADSGTVATLVPGAEFSTRSPVYPDGRRLLDAGVTVALATDCNPGTSYTTSMPFVIALAVRDCGLTPSEAVWAATAGGAAALRRDDVGHLGVGAHAWLTVLDAPSHHHLAYRPGVPLARLLAAPEGVPAMPAGDGSPGPGWPIPPR